MKCDYCNNTGLAFGIEFSDAGWTFAYQGELYEKAIARRSTLISNQDTSVKVRTAAGPCICSAADKRALRIQAKKNKEEANK